MPLVEGGLSRRNLFKAAAVGTAAVAVAELNAGCTPGKKSTPEKPIFTPSPTPTPTETQSPAEKEKLRGDIQDFVAGVARRLKTDGEAEKKRKEPRFTFDANETTDGEVEYNIDSLAIDAQPGTNIYIGIAGKKGQAGEIDPEQVRVWQVIKFETFPDGHKEMANIKFRRQGDNDWYVLRKTDSNAETTLERDGKVVTDNSFTNPGPKEQQLTSSKFTSLSSEATSLIDQALS